MNCDNFFKISEFAKIGGISRKMLIHYDKMGVLKPEYTNTTTKYRYYSMQQIKTLKMIKTLQFLGISLSEIKKDYIDSGIEDYTKNLKKEKKIIGVKFQEIQRAKKLIEDQLDCLEEISNLNEEENFKIKNLPKRYLISSQLKNTSIEEITKILHPLEKKLAKRGFFMMGEIALVKKHLKKYQENPKYFFGIFSTKKIDIGDTHNFEFKSGDYLSFYTKAYFWRKGRFEYVDLSFKKNFEHLNQWCKENGYEVETETDVLVIPILLPFLEMATQICEIQVKVNKINTY